MRVRYSARIARWIAERERVAEEADGSVAMDVPVLSEEWAVRRVLRYGPDAVVDGGWLYLEGPALASFERDIVRLEAGAGMAKALGHPPALQLVPPVDHPVHLRQHRRKLAEVALAEKPPQTDIVVSTIATRTAEGGGLSTRRTSRRDGTFVSTLPRSARRR